jgi:gamma-glutamylcysteine synthetase
MSDQEYEEEEFRGSGTRLPDGFVDKQAMDAAVGMERDLHPEETHEELTLRLLRESVPQVAMQIVHLALQGSSERLRLEAGKYVVDRVLGPLGRETHRADSPLDKMVRQMQQDAEKAANESYNS